MRVGLKFFVGSKNRPPAVRVALKKSQYSPAQLVGDRVKTHHLRRSRRTRERKFVSVELIIATEALDEQVVAWHPNRASPVRVPAEQRAVGFSRLIVHLVMHPVVFIVVWPIEVSARQGSHTVGR